MSRGNATPNTNQYIWALTSSEVCEQFQTDPHLGLSEEEAKIRIERYGLNEIPKSTQGFLKVYLAPLFNWMIVIYLISALIMLVVGKITDESEMMLIYITLAIVGLNSFVAIYQQFRATKKLKALQDLSAPTTTVIRGGEKHEILTKHVTLGDLLELGPGDRVPADARLISGSNMRLNEASLTGESEPTLKNANPLRKTALAIQNRENILFYGTFIATGRCLAICYAIGPMTEIGAIAAGIEAAETTEIPIQKKLNNIGKWFGIGVVSAWVLILVILYTTTGEFDIIKSLNSAMDIMPINIPLLTTIVMLTGVLKLAEHGMIIRNLTSVDSLGRISVVCSDKTGTLTKSQMSVQFVWARGSTFSVSGSGYKPEGIIHLIDNPEKPVRVDDISEYPHLHLLVRGGYLNNNASLVKHEFEAEKQKTRTDWKILGSPTEGSLLSLAYKTGVCPGKQLDCDDEYRVVMEFPFSSDVKRMTKIFHNNSPDNDSGKYIVFTKGASEILITSCSKLLADNGKSMEFYDELRLVMMNTVNSYAVRGYRILSFAYQNIDNLPPETEEGRDLIESDLIYIGFVAIMDPPRDGVKEAITRCHDAGVNVVMITGDSLPTATAIAKQIGIITKPTDRVMEGNAISHLDPEEDINDVKVFARVSPSHKETIVDHYQRHGRVVAMTGDGVNDALALNMADAGIAMGISGTDVAKESSDMIISDDSFNSIVEGIYRGRGIFANIRSLVFFFISINLFEGIVQFIISVILKMPYYMDDEFYFQWVFLSLTLHMFPGFILTFDRISKDVMKEKPRDSEEILSENVVLLMAVYGILLASSMVITYIIGINGWYPVWDSSFQSNIDFGALNSQFLYTTATQDLWAGVSLINAKTLTMLMATLYFCECALALQIRRPNKSLWKSLKDDGTPFIYIIIGLLFATFLAIMYIPGLQISLASLGFNPRFMRLTLLDWIVCFAISMVCIGGFEFVKWIARKRTTFF